MLEINCNSHFFHLRIKNGKSTFDFTIYKYERIIKKYTKLLEKFAELDMFYELLGLKYLTNELTESFLKSKEVCT